MAQSKFIAYLVPECTLNDPTKASVLTLGIFIHLVGGLF